MNKFGDNRGINNGQCDEPEAILDELDSLKDLLDNELLTNEAEGEVGTTSASYPAAQAGDEEETPININRDSVAIDREITEIASQAYEEPAQLQQATVPVPEEIGVIPPLLDEVIITGDELPGEPLELIATLYDNEKLPEPAIDRAELEILVDTLIEREIDTLRDQLRERLMNEIKRLLPQIK